MPYTNKIKYSDTLEDWSITLHTSIKKRESKMKTFVAP